MNKHKTFSSNLKYALLAQSTMLAASVVMSLVVSRLLDTDAFAYWQLFTFYTSYVSLFYFGLADGLYLRYGGAAYKDLSKSLIKSQLLIMLVLNLIVIITLYILGHLFVTDPDRRFVITTSLLHLLTMNVWTVFGYLFQAVNNTRAHSISVICGRVSFLTFLLIFILTRQAHFQLYIIAFMASQAIAMLYCLIAGRDILLAKAAPLHPAFREFLKSCRIGISLTFSNLVSGFVIGSSRLVVDGVWGIAAFGKFSFAISLSNIFLQFIAQVGMVLFPALRQIRSERRITLYDSIDAALNVLLPCILLTFFPARLLLQLWLPAYEMSFSYLALLMPICVFDSKMNLQCTTYFKVLRKEKALLALNLGTLALSFLLSAISAWAIGSIFAVIVSIVIAIAARCITAQLYLARVMGIKMRREFIALCLLMAIFMLLSWRAPLPAAFFGYLAAYGFYLLLGRTAVHSFLTQVLSRLKKTGK